PSHAGPSGPGDALRSPQRCPSAHRSRTEAEGRRNARWRPRSAAARAECRLPRPGHRDEGEGEVAQAGTAVVARRAPDARLPERALHVAAGSGRDHPVVPRPADPARPGAPRGMRPFPTTREELENAGYALDTTGQCRGPRCKGDIWWWWTPRKKRIPLNPDCSP